MTKNFGELTNGSRFTLNGTEYIKTTETRISCCKSINAQAVNNPNHKIYVKSSMMVNTNA